MYHSLDYLCRIAVVQILLGAAMSPPAVAGGHSTRAAVLQQRVVLATVQHYVLNTHMLCGCPA
jgi:hypothetical protein